MQLLDLDLSATYTYADYLKLATEERLELINGEIFRMGHSPNRMHQKIAVCITSKLFRFLENKTCEVYSAPFRVRLSGSEKDEDVITVLQPDICVVCDISKLDDKGCLGAPDIVVEILSPGNNRKELKNKFEVYEECGVKEYWIIHPSEKTFMKYTLDNEGKYVPSHLLTEGDEVTTPVLPGFVLDLEEVFKD
jgi:Uma2 family endonuclease